MSLAKIISVMAVTALSIAGGVHRSVVLGFGNMPQTGLHVVAPANSQTTPIGLGLGTWVVGNARTSGSSPYAHAVDVEQGVSRQSGAQNGADGGYLVLSREVTAASTWRATFRLYVSDDTTGALPFVATQLGAPPTFVDPKTFSGLKADGSDYFILTPPNDPPKKATRRVNRGRWVAVEIVSGPDEAELRFWDVGSQRPTDPDAKSASLGELRRTAFIGCDRDPFDWSIDDVLVESWNGSTWQPVFSESFTL